MIDYGARKTDLAVKRAEWRLSRVYRQAEREIQEKMETWQKRHAAREKLYRQQLKDGKITQADFDAWMRGQVFQGKQWQARKEQIQAVLLNADKTAAKIVNDGKLGVFVDNANYIGYGLEHDANINTGFMLYDEQTVARLIKSDPQILPKPAPGVKKDKAYIYYNKLVNGAITQGIIQGEDIRQIAKRIARETGERSYKSAVRNARTAFTGAQNAGRIEGLHQAQRLGIEVKKKWLATLDGRTRDSHRHLDGQIQEVDDPFISELGKIRFPGDPTANGGDVYNCRCTLTYVYPEYPSEMQRRDNETGEIVGDMTYEEWERMKRQAANQSGIARTTVVNGRDITETWERRPDRFDFEIEDVINAQGFDGLPTIVDAEEFDRLAKENGFLAMRGYVAPDKETLDSYRYQLYHGKWYVDCSKGGAMYGQGMYAGANFTGEMSPGVKRVSEGYAGNGFGYVETFTMQNARFVAYTDINREFTGTAISEMTREKLYSSLTEDESLFLDLNASAFFPNRQPDWEKASEAAQRLGNEGRSKVMGLWMDTMRQTQERSAELRKKYKDVGAYAAACGYDGIVCGSREEDGVYVVILNRTKTIIRRPE